MKTKHYNVLGLVNSESRTKLNNSLDKIEGVQRVAIDISRGTIEIEYNEPASEEVIPICIKKTGYSVI